MFLTLLKEVKGRMFPIYGCEVNYKFTVNWSKEF